MKRLKITPVKHTQSGRWQVRIPAKLSGSGKRETKYFPTKAEAMGYLQPGRRCCRVAFGGNVDDKIRI